MAKLEHLNFQNTYADLPDVFYQRVKPTPFPNPSLVSVNPAAVELLDIDPTEWTRPEFAEYFCGAKLLPGGDPIAMLYSGHQFGHYVPQLGDGRAIMLGEVQNQNGERWELQLKGAGLTRFSRDGDGRAVMRSTIREYLCGEAMHGLGIPTTRSLCIVAGEEIVWRETPEPGAMLLRMAPTHVRFGSFEVFYYRRQHEYLKTLADYVIEYHFPHLVGAENPYARLLHEVAVRTGQLVAQWQAVGWAHGVLNTDNMSILGLTLDYGPFGFMERYDPTFICNHSDHHGRYSFQNQPDIGFWNIRALARALSPLVAQDAVNGIPEIYEKAMVAKYAELMRAKLGLIEAHAGDDKLVTDLLNLLDSSRVDYTNLFRGLGAVRQERSSAPDELRDQFLHREAFDDWTARYRERLRAEKSDDGERQVRMDQVNPKYILRNHLAQQAIVQAVQQKDYSEVDRLLNLLGDPFTDRPGMESYAAPPPPGEPPIIVSCSS
ncbi:protein adenylyltransferase SelO [Candidatus Nitrospira neomarina]|uniref:Protein nucleotidyltransferase YdiU n=1 Tax=Candidatus Nitrospira neomarina TaxID=3020899 RepID=A0AA96GJ67_9BACT|nr:YdiU family protein [Candidatus Nitrospira neomarina]WNM61315.1 YdiU family protein [Candidatus Nitrospira neomarina]